MIGIFFAMLLFPVFAYKALRRTPGYRKRGVSVYIHGHVMNPEQIGDPRDAKNVASR